MFYSRYKRDLAAANSRVSNSGSRVLASPLGPIEYLEWGQGLPVLWVHGILGGADQGPGMAGTYLGEGFRVIAVSRFGYLQSPLPENASPEAQADQLACLLDALEIHKAALVGTSAGSASSFQFALRHPDRCSALVLWSMAVPPYKIPPRWLQSFLRAYFGSDLLMWATMTYFPAKMFQIMGVPQPIQHQLTIEERQWLTRAMTSFLPTSGRIQGIMNDIAKSNPGMNDIQIFEQIYLPMLIIHAVDDPMPPFAVAKASAERFPNTYFMEIKAGGHLLLGHFEEVRAAMAGFIQQNASEMWFAANEVYRMTV